MAWAVFEVARPADDQRRGVALRAPGRIRHGRVFGVARSPRHDADSAFAAQLCERAGLVVRVIDGFCVSTGEPPDGRQRRVRRVGAVAARREPRSSATQSDTFALLERRARPGDDGDSRRRRGVNVAEPIVVLNESSTTASFSRTQIVVGRGASVTVVEYFEGGRDALVVPRE